MHIIAISNQKGGVGKTATTLSLAVALAETGKRVLLIDLDPQAGLSVTLGFRSIDDSSDPSILEALLGKHPIASAIYETKNEKIHLAPASLNLSAAEKELAERGEWHLTLKRLLEQLPQSYDFVLIDCPPSLGTLTTNALAASRLVLVPLQTDFLALDGADRVLGILQDIEEDTNPNLDVRFVRTMYDRRTRHSREVANLAEQHFPEYLFGTVIPYSVKFKDASYKGESILTYDQLHPGARAYRQLAKELLTYFEDDPQRPN